VREGGALPIGFVDEVFTELKVASNLQDAPLKL
jgi:hypothetical protein